MKSVYAEVDSRALTYFNHLVLQLFLNLSYHFLDACGVDTAVSNELMECQTASLTANGVEGRDNDGLGSIVNNDFHTTGSFQSTNVTSFTSDDASLHIVVVNVEHADE